MQWRNTLQEYGVVHKAFHWLIAALIIVNLVLGLEADDMAMSPTKFRLFFWHKSIGMTVLALATLRLVWKLLNPRPAKMPDHAPWERGLAALVHVLLYVAMITMPLSGWLGSAAKGIAVSVFGWFTLPNLVPPDKQLGHWLFVYHSYAGWALIGLIALHALGAIKHHVIDRDDTLRRMMPFARLKHGATIAALLCSLALPAYATPPAWTIDPAHSHLTFTGTQNKAPFTGTFAKFSGEIVFDPADLPHSHIAITIPLGTLTTGSDERDPYLGQPAWFDTARFPQATFTAAQITAAGSGHYIAHGQVTIHGVAKPLDLPFTVAYANGGKTATATGTTTLNRLDFDIGTGEWGDPGVVGTSVTVNVTIVATHL